MVRLQLKCAACEKELSGGLDTYGDPGHEMCYDCLKLLDSEEEFSAIWKKRRASLEEYELRYELKTVRRQGEPHEKATVVIDTNCPHCGSFVELVCKTCTWALSGDLWIHQGFDELEGYCTGCEQFTDGVKAWS